MTNYEKVIGEFDLDGTSIRVCRGQDEDDPINNHVYYFIERDLTIPDLAKMLRSRKESVKLPDHVLKHLTGCARLWLSGSGWALEYMESDDAVPGYWPI